VANNIIRDVQVEKRRRESRSFEPRLRFDPAVLVEVSGAVEVAGRPNYVWCSEYAQPQSYFMAYNNKVKAIAGLTVIVGFPEKEPFKRKIVGLWDDFEALGGANPGDAGDFDLPVHGQSHQYPSESNPGTDPVLIYQPALQMLKTNVTGTNLFVQVQSLRYRINGVFKIFAGGILDLSAYVPIPANQARYVLIYLDGFTNTLLALPGTAVPITPTLPPKPLTPAGGYSSSYVYLQTGQTTISIITDVIDARAFLAPEPDNGLVLGATQIGQILYSTDGIAFTPQLPMIGDDDLILIDPESGIIIVT